MHTIETIYIIAALTAISACLPQIRQLIITKASDELNLGTWSVWLMTQCVTLTYVASIENLLMTIVNIAWVTFYAVMVGLIVYYRRTNKTTVQPVPLTSEDAS